MAWVPPTPTDDNQHDEGHADRQASGTSPEDDVQAALAAHPQLAWWFPPAWLHRGILMGVIVALLVGGFIWVARLVGAGAWLPVGVAFGALVCAVPLIVMIRWDRERGLWMIGTLMLLFHVAFMVLLVRDLAPRLLAGRATIADGIALAFMLLIQCPSAWVLLGTTAWNFALSRDAKQA